MVIPAPERCADDALFDDDFDVHAGASASLQTSGKQGAAPSLGDSSTGKVVADKVASGGYRRVGNTAVADSGSVTVTSAFNFTGTHEAFEIPATSNNKSVAVCLCWRLPCDGCHGVCRAFILAGGETYSSSLTPPAQSLANKLKQSV